MKPALKSEFRKLLSVRTTYITTAFVVLFVTFIAIYVEGWRLKPIELAKTDQLSSDVLGAVSLSIFGAVIAILQMTHEYGYNTITYTLTSSDSRSRVLLSKFIVISCYALVLTALISVLSPVMTYLGVHAAGHSLAPQHLYYKDLAWRSLFFGWSYGMIGLVLATIIRSQVGSIVALFITPAAIEPLLSQLLNSKAVYLPFTSLGMVTGNESVKGNSITPERGALVFLVYLAIGWAVAWYLFLRRDATN